MSIGISFYLEDGASMESLVKKADRAMYEAEKEGNIFRLYQPGL